MVLPSSLGSAAMNSTAALKRSCCSRNFCSFSEAVRAFDSRYADPTLSFEPASKVSGVKGSILPSKIGVATRARRPAAIR